MNQKVVVLTEQGGMYCPNFSAALGREVREDESTDWLRPALKKRPDLQRAFRSGPWLLVVGDELPSSLADEDPENEGGFVVDPVGAALDAGVALRPNEFIPLDGDTGQLAVALLEYVIPIADDCPGSWALLSDPTLNHHDRLIAIECARYLDRQDITPTTTLGDDPDHPDLTPDWRDA